MKGVNIETESGKLRKMKCLHQTNKLQNIINFFKTINKFHFIR